MAQQIYEQYTKEKGYPPKTADHLTKFAKQKGIKVMYKDVRDVMKAQNKNVSTQMVTKQPKIIKSQAMKPQRKQSTPFNVNDGEKLWRLYVNKTGNPPQKPFDLMMFSHKHNEIQTINIRQAKDIFDTLNKQPSAPRHKRTMSVLYQIKVHYSGKIYLISVHNSVKKYTVADLRKEVLQKYINEPANSLIFKMKSVPIQYSMDIISYLKQLKKREAVFEIQVMDRDHAVSKTQKSAYQQEMDAKGDNVKKLIASLKEKFGEAYFTQDLDVDEKKQEKKPKSLGNWDQNLNEAVTNVVIGQQSKMFDEIVKKFDEKIDKTLTEHEQITNHVQNAKVDKTAIKQQMDAMLDKRRSKMENKYTTKLKEIEEAQKVSNVSWEKVQKDSLQNSNYNASVKEKIEKERNKRTEYQQRVIANGRREYLRELEKINKLHDGQTNDLLCSDNIKSWHNKFKTEDIQTQKVQTLKEMITNKIETTGAQIKFAKYLHNSPFAQNLKEDAQKLDHEITKIATLAGEPLFIDIVDRNAHDTDNNNNNDDEKEEEEKYLEFELRFDDSYSNHWNDTKQLQIKQQLAVMIGIDATHLDFISSRKGCIIAKFKAKLKAVYQKAKEIGKKLVGAVQYGAKQLKKEMKQLSDKVFYGNKWAQKVDECIPFLEGRLGAIKTSKDAIYLASKCVAVIVSHFTANKNKKVLDSDFLNDDAEKQAYKIIMDPQWDKEYGPEAGKTHWNGAIQDGIDRGGYPYFCPNGWKRYGIKVDNFTTKYTGWSVCYHGSETYYMGSIMSHGIFGTQDTTQRYFSPSIEYSAFPRYAMPKKLKNGKYIQTIFQCRINSDPTIMRTKGSTSGYADGSVIIDPNFDKNTQKTAMEWYLEAPNLDQYVVYGIMVRVCDDPTQLPSSHWWRLNLAQLKSYYTIMDQ